MYILKQLNRKLLNYLSVVLVVATLLVFPPTATHQFPFFDLSADLSRVNAQPSKPEGEKKSEGEKSESGKPKEPKLPLSQDGKRERLTF